MSWPVLPLGLLGSQASTAAPTTDNDTYQISKSLRFNSADSTYLTRTFATAGNRKTWTWSGWVKRSGFGVSLQYLFCSNNSSGGNTTLGFYGLNVGNETLALNPASGQSNVGIISTQSFRDPSAWYHIVASVDTTQAVQENRFKLYVNGSQITSFSSADYTSSFNTDYYVNNAISHTVGCGPTNVNFFNGYMAEVNFIDGQALTPSSFGETDATTGRWKAKAFSGNYGTNGFYLNFSNNSSTQSLGWDQKGNITRYIASGTYSYTVPTYSSSLVVEVWGGGGGGGQALLPGTDATNGGQSSFNGTVIANGGNLGVGASSGVGTNGAGGTASGGDTNTTGNTGNSTAGVSSSTPSPNSGNLAIAGVVGPGGFNGITGFPVGSGGGGAYWSGGSVPTAGAGGSGGYSKKTYAPSAISGTITVVVGAGGAAGVGNALPGGAGTDGMVRITVDGATIPSDWYQRNLSVTPGTGNDSLTDSPSNYGAISTTLVDDTYQISKSLRFNSADSAYLNRTPASAGNKKTWTWSGWVKRNKTSQNDVLFDASNNASTTMYVIRITSANDLEIGGYASGYNYQIVSTQLFKDPSAWYHVVVAFDTTQLTASNRIKLYINGSQVTSFSASSYPTQDYAGGLINDTVQHRIGSAQFASQMSDEYLAEINFIDGQALTPTSFGTRDINTYLWKPKAFTGTYGTNGFYLPFSDNSSTTALGYDKSGAYGTSNLFTGGTPSADSTLNGTSYPASMAFDNLFRTTVSSDKWIRGATGNGGFLRYLLPVTKVAKAYRIWGYSDPTRSEQAPNSWVFQGSNDGTTWTTLDTQSSVSWGSSIEPRTFVTTNTTSYLYYQIASLTTPNAAHYITVYEFQLYEVGTTGFNHWTPNNLSVTEDSGNDSLVDSPTYYGTLSTTPSEDTYQISRSLRFKGINTSLSRTPTTAGNRKTWTWSAWVKRSKLGISGDASTVQQLFNRNDSGGVSNYTYIYFLDDNSIQFLDSTAGSAAGTSYLTTKAKFTDTTNWYHIVLAVDSTQVNETHRQKLYVNGTLITSFTSVSWIGINNQTQIGTLNAHHMGSNRQGSQFFSGYFAEVNHIDGIALGADSFGVREAGTYLWKPKAYTGAYGTNGFYLPFSDNTSPTSSATGNIGLGKDFSGNTNFWTTEGGISTATGATSIVNNDSFIDVPTYYGTDNGAGGEARGSYCTLNPNSTTTGTFSNGNLRFVGPSNPWARANGTIKVSSGKWYYEVILANAPYSPRNATSGWNGFGFGLSSVVNSSTGANYPIDAILLLDSGHLGNFAVAVSDVGALVSGDVLSIAVDLDANTFTFRRNNISFATGTIGGTPGRSLVPCIVSYDAQYGVMDANFGQRAFKYTAPAGFKALRDYNKPPVPTGGELRGDYATLDPLSPIRGTLLDGNLRTNGGDRGSISTIGMTSGKWFCEMSVISIGAESSLGLSKGINIMNSYVGSSVDSWGYYFNGFKYSNSSSLSYGSPYTTSDIIGAAFDADAGTLTFYKNGAYQGVAYSSLNNGPYYFATSGRSSGAANDVAINFGQRPWAYEAPFGFKPLRDYNKLPTPTGGEVRGNYATLNPLQGTGITANFYLNNGNLDLNVSNNSGYRNLAATFSPEGFKGYCEITMNTSPNSYIGFANESITPSNAQYTAAGTFFIDSSGDVYNGTTSIKTGCTPAFSSGNTLQIAFDFTGGARNVWFGRNGTWGSNAIGIGIPSTGTNPVLNATNITEATRFHFGINTGAGLITISANFGQRPWAYDAPFGFKPLCTTLLPQPIVQKSSSYFDAVTYTGTGATQSITSLGFSPNLLWTKGRTLAQSNNLFDTLRSGQRLRSDTTGLEVATTVTLGSNGFTLGAETESNNVGSTFVAWAWDESPIAGVDIVTASLSGTSPVTVNHLLGVAPKMIIGKIRSNTSNWYVNHSGLANNVNYYVTLNSTALQASSSNIWDGAPTSTSFVVGNPQNGWNGGTVGSANYVFYLFAEVEGFSKFGSYTGNGLADGPFVYCGFRPRWVMIKNASTGGLNYDWEIFDSSRDTFNECGKMLEANMPDLENANGNPIDILSNGFKMRSSGPAQNSSGGTIIFAAFAEAPFKYARAR